MEHKTGFVALSGRPNAGKSTLLNAVLGQVVSIVSSKPQTTRNRIVGVHNLDDVQIIFVDTPGTSRGRDELGRRMLRGAREAVSDADVVVQVVDAARLQKSEAAGDFRPAGKPMVVALNKVDKVRPKDQLLSMIQRFSDLENVAAVVPISALKRQGLEALVDEIAGLLPEGPPLYPREMITDRPERFLAAELVRAAVLRHTRHEVPHAAAVAVTAWRESPKGCHIEAVIYIEKASQKGILIGRGGAMIKRIGEAARAEITTLLDCTAHLNLRVEVAAQWRGDPEALRHLGYDES